MTRAGDTTARRRARGPAVAVLLVATLFLAGPTPGDVGGCGGSLANEPLPGDPGEQEYDYFETGFCANMCLRLKNCGLLCRALRSPGACDNDSVQAYQQCVRGDLRGDIFAGTAPGTTTQCPHSCGNYMRRYQGASNMDVEVCGHAISAVTCGALADVLRNPPRECLAVCQ